MNLRLLSNEDLLDTLESAIEGADEVNDIRRALDEIEALREEVLRRMDGGQ